MFQHFFIFDVMIYKLSWFDYYSVYECIKTIVVNWHHFTLQRKW